MNKIDFFYSDISQNAIERTMDVLKSSFVSEGEIVKEFETKLERKFKLQNVVTVNSGTSALHLSLAVCGIGKGDEVLLPAQTFVATGLAVLMTGAKPVFVDIQYETGNIAPKSIINKITDRTKAIIPVHWGGYPCDMLEILKIANENNFFIIEDAAHALGAYYRNKPIGTISDFTTFSFQAIKHLTTGDGGALCCKNKKDYKKAKALRWFGIDRMDSKPSLLGEREYDIKELGFKYHMNNIAAAIGLGNMDNINEQLKKRREIAEAYRGNLRNIPGISLLDYKEDRLSANWLFTILVENRHDFIKKCNSNNIPVSVVHLGIDKNSIFGGVDNKLENQRRFDEFQISIPLHANLNEEDINFIIKTIKSGW